MTCREYRKLIIKYIYDKISKREREKMDKHIKSCEYCTFEMVECNRLMNLVSELPEIQPSPFFESSLRAKLRQAKAYNESKRWFGSKKLAFAGVVSLMFILVFSLLYIENNEKYDSHALTGIENELISFSSSGEDNFRHFVMPSVSFYENANIEINNEGRNYVLTSINTSNEANYILDKIIIHQNSIMKNIVRGRE